MVVRYGDDEFTCSQLDWGVVAVRQRLERIDADLAASGCAAVSSGVVQPEPEAPQTLPAANTARDLNPTDGSR